MARAGMQQAEIVQANIVTLLKDRHAKLENYVPTYLEGSLKLSLGKVSPPPYERTILMFCSGCFGHLCRGWGGEFPDSWEGTW